MKLFHVSDTHLGYSAYARMDPERGINQREADFYDSWGRFVEISLRENPDIILHSGDLFDSVRPSNRAISFALERIKEITDSGIEFVAISGNHETPRLKETGSVFRILEHLPHCHMIFDGGMQKIVLDGIEILCLPHSTEEVFRKGLFAAADLERELPRIVMMHAGVVGLGVFRTEEINELILNPSDLDRLSADYIALGHYHEYTQVSSNTFYSGSTERLSISEASSEKGFIEVDLESGGRKFRILPSRKMIDLSAIDFNTDDANEAKRIILQNLESEDIEGAIVRMTIKGLSRNAQRSLDMNSIRRIAQNALSFELKILREEEEQTIRSSDAHIGTLEQELRKYLQMSPLGDDEKKRLEELALKYFSEQEE